MPKYKATFKAQDALDYALEYTEGEEREKARDLMRKFVRWGEYVTIEFDTDNHAATVLEVKG